MKIAHGDLRVAISNALAFAGTDDTLPVLAAVNMVADERTLTLRSTDRHKLLRQVIDVPQVRIGVDGSGKPIFAAQPGEAWSVNFPRDQIKHALAALKLNHGSRWDVLVDVEFNLDGLSVGGVQVPHVVDNQFPEVDRLIEGLPDQIAPEFDGRIGFGPQHLAALDKLRQRPTDRHSPPVRFRIVAGGKNSEPVLFEPATQVDGLTIDGLIMPFKLDA